VLLAENAVDPSSARQSSARRPSTVFQRSAKRQASCAYTLRSCVLPVMLFASVPAPSASQLPAMLDVR
jgi:hypothetical protein